MWIHNGLKQDKTLIYIKSGDIIFENENTQESIYSFICVQQNYEKKLLKLELSHAGNIFICT